MKWLRGSVLVLALMNGAWMTFDGTRALVAGDYFTPRSGRYAGQLGPWARIVSAAGIEPRSTLMKCVFVGYGVAWLSAALAFARRAPRSFWMMVAAAAGALWYYPAGTASSLIQLALLAGLRTRAGQTEPGPR